MKWVWLECGSFLLSLDELNELYGFGWNWVLLGKLIAVNVVRY